MTGRGRVWGDRWPNTAEMRGPGPLYRFYGGPGNFRMSLNGCFGRGCDK